MKPRVPVVSAGEWAVNTRVGQADGLRQGRCCAGLRLAPEEAEDPGTQKALLPLSQADTGPCPAAG